MHINTQFWCKRNICAYMYFCVYVCIYSVLIFFRYISMNETDGSYDSSTFRYLRNLHTILRSCCINLHFHQKSTLASSFFHICTNILLFVDFLMIVILTGVSWYLIVLELHFFDDYWSWTSFHMLIGHLYIFLEKNASSSLCIFFNQVVWLLSHKK